MPIKDLFNKDTQNAIGLAGIKLKKAFAPATGLAKKTAEEFTSNVTPVVENIKQTVTQPFEPVQQAFAQTAKRNENISKINKFLADKGVTMEDIENLAKVDGSDPQEAIKFFQDNGIMIQGMEEIQSKMKEQSDKEAEIKRQEDLSKRGLQVSEGYEPVDALSRNIGGFVDEYGTIRRNPDDSFLESLGKTAVNLPGSALKLAAGIGDIGLSAAYNIGEGPIDTVSDTIKSKIINPTYQGALDIAEKTKQAYEKGRDTEYTDKRGIKTKGGTGMGIVSAASDLLERGNRFIVENPAQAIGTLTGIKNIKRGVESVKSAGSDIAKGNIKTGVASLAKDTAQGVKETVIDPITMGLKAPLEAVKLGGKIVKKTAEKAGVPEFSAPKKAAALSTKANRFNALDEEKFIQQIGETPGEFATSRGMNEVGERAVAKAIDFYKKSIEKADESVAMIEGRFTTKGSKNDILGDLMRGNMKKMEDQPRNPDAKRVKELYDKYENDQGMTMKEINEAKRIYARNHKFNWDQRQSDAAANATYIQNDLRNWQMKVAQENGLTNLSDINRNTKAWKMFADSLEKKLDRSGANNAVSLSDWVALAGGNLSNVALFAGKKFFSMPAVKSKIIKSLSKTSKPSIIEGSKGGIIQSNFDKNVNPTGIPTDRGRAGGESMVRPKGLLPKPSDAAIKAQEEAILRKKIKSESTNKAKGIINAKKATEEAIKTPDITPKSVIKRPGTVGIVPKSADQEITAKESNIVASKNGKTLSKDVDVNNENHMSAIYDKYIKENKYGKNIVVDSDKVKEMFADFDPKNPQTIHEKSSVIGKTIFERALRENKGSKVVFTAGGGGSGKSEILIKSIPKDEGAIVYDGTGKNYKKLVGMYDQAVASGKKPEIQAVYIDFNTAKKFNAKRSRNVPEDILTDTHGGYRKTLLQIVKDRPDIDVNLTINTGMRYTNGKPITIRVPKQHQAKFLEKVQELE